MCAALPWGFRLKDTAVLADKLLPCFAEDWKASYASKARSVDGEGALAVCCP